jgi:predicted Rossmann-fold nucleotide-binding protein
MSGLRVLVCGGRDYDNRAVLYADLDGHHKRQPFALVITGGAKGADQLAREWAEDRGLPVMVFPANWAKHGKAAGPRRNQTMLDFGKPDLVVSFAGGAGTYDMIRRAQAAGVRLANPHQGEAG